MARDRHIAFLVIATQEHVLAELRRVGVSVELQQNPAALLCFDENHARILKSGLYGDERPIECSAAIFERPHGALDHVCSFGKRALWPSQQRTRRPPLYNRDDRYCEGLSFWAAKQIHKFAKKQDMAFVTEEQRVRARVKMREFWSQFVIKKVVPPREARRLLAQEQPTLEGTRIAHDTAPARHDGRGKTQEVALELFGLDRVDATTPVKGIAKHKGSKKKAAHTSPPASITTPDTERTPLVLPGDAPGYVPSTTGGWDGNA